MRAYSLLELRREPELLKTAKQYVFDRLARRPLSSQDRQNISAGAVGGSLSVSGIQPAGWQSRDHGLIRLNISGLGLRFTVQC